jgi:hydroxyacylglutathione hydrolase
LREVGRLDLAIAADILSSDLAGMLYDSIQKIKLLDKNMRIYLGHGAGSSCGKSIGAGNFCNLGVHHETNYCFTITDRK